MEKIDIKELERIPIPEGLEERLEAKIDEWARPTLTEKHAHKTPLLGRGWGRFSLAASFLLVCGIGLYFALAPTTNKGTTDTYSDPQLACQEAERALNLLSANLNKGLAQYEQAIN